MKLIEGMNYRQWQKRNTLSFQSLSKKQQKEARKKGYYNIGWINVKKSWNIIINLNDNVISLFDYKLNQGDITGAIDLELLELDKAKKVAQEGQKNFKKFKQKLDEIASKALKTPSPL
jgi:hypothetical protein